jgi:hypothetical protein
MLTKQGVSLCGVFIICERKKRPEIIALRRHDRALSPLAAKSTMRGLFPLTASIHPSIHPSMPITTPRETVHTDGRRKRF